MALSRVSTEIFEKDWEGAKRELDRAEKKGLCKEAKCLSLRAKISHGAGEGAQALEYARRALALSGPNSGLGARDLNELGAILYWRSQHNREVLKLAETAFRQADAAASTRTVSNIRFNLAVVLRDLDQHQEAKKIMAELEAAGMLIDPGMAILGDFQGVGLPHQ